MNIFELIAQLNAEEKENQISTIAQLAELKSSAYQAVPDLIKKLHDCDADIQEHVTKALIEIGVDEWSILKPLLTMAESSSITKRKAAVKVLRKIALGKNKDQYSLLKQKTEQLKVLLWKEMDSLCTASKSDEEIISFILQNVGEEPIEANSPGNKSEPENNSPMEKAPTHRQIEGVEYNTKGNQITFTTFVGIVGKKTQEEPARKYPQPEKKESDSKSISKPVLKIEITPGLTQAVELTKPITIGRGKDNDIVLLYSSVSRSHAEIYFDESDIIIKDLNSANETFVNNHSISTKVLQDGDVIVVGETTIFFLIEIWDEPSLIVDLMSKTLADYSMDEIIYARDIYFRFPSDDESIAEIYEIANQKFQLIDSLSDMEKINLDAALNEAIGNAQRHGHQYNAELPIEFRYIHKQDHLIMRVTDQGEGFDYREQLRRKREGSAVEEARARYKAGGYGGLGILLMLKCTRVSEEAIKEVEEEPIEAPAVTTQKTGEDEMITLGISIPLEEDIIKPKKLPTEISELPTFEKYLSSDAGRPGFIERFVAQSVLLMKTIQITIGLKFIIIANALDTLVGIVTSYINSIFQAWKNYRTIRRRLQRKDPHHQIQEVAKDLARSRFQLARFFSFIGFYPEESLEKISSSELELDLISPSFALKLALETRGHLDEMKRDLSLLTVHQATQTTKKTISEFLISFIPNPVEWFSGMKDVFILAFFMKYSRAEIKGMYVDLVVSYRQVLDILYEEAHSETEVTHSQKTLWALTDYESNLLQKTDLPQQVSTSASQNLDICIEKSTQSLQRIIQMLCKPDAFLDPRRWSRWDLLREVREMENLQQWHPLCVLELEQWLSQQVATALKKKGIPLDIREKELRLQEMQEWRHRYQIQKWLSKRFL